MAPPGGQQTPWGSLDPNHSLSTWQAWHDSQQPGGGITGGAPGGASTSGDAYTPPGAVAPGPNPPSGPIYGGQPPVGGMPAPGAPHPLWQQKTDWLRQNMPQWAQNQGRSSLDMIRFMGQNPNSPLAQRYQQQTQGVRPMPMPQDMTNYQGGIK
jgi:hypothetical protein